MVWKTGNSGATRLVLMISWALFFVIFFQNCGDLILTDSFSRSDNSLCVGSDCPPLVRVNSAQAQWQSVPIRTAAQKTAGFFGGEGMQMIFDIDYAPTNPNTVYMVNDTSQVWKSVNGGGTWTTSHVGFRAMGGSCLAVSPFNENVVFVAGGAMDSANLDTGIQGIFRTLDGGNTWSQVRSHYTKRYNNESGGDLICFTGSKTVYAGTANEGLLRSTDGGTIWSKIATPTQLGASNIEVLDVKVTGTSADGVYPKTLYVVTKNSTYKIRKVVDNGASVTITTIGAGLPSYPNAIAIAPTSPTTFYATVRNYGVYKSTDSGLHFNNINSAAMASFLANDTGRRAEYIDVSPVDSNYVFVGFNRKTFFYSWNAGNAWSAPSTWDEENAGGWISGSVMGYNDASLGSYHRIPIAVHPTNKNILLIAGDYNHIKKSSDGGKNFRYSNTGYTAGRAGFDPTRTDISTISWNNANRFIFFFTDAGPYLTEDGGSTFKYLKIPPVNGQTSTLAGAFDPTPDSNIVVTAVGNWSSQRIKISRNVNESSPSWTEISGSDDKYQYIAFHPTDNNIVYAGQYRFNSIQTNNNYVLLSKDVDAMYKGNGDIVYSVESAGTNITRIYKSEDKGATWTNPYSDLSVSAAEVGQITIDPNDADKIYVAVNYKGVYIFDGGTWSLKNEDNGLSKDWLPSLYTQYVTVDPNSPENARVLYAGSRPPGRNGQANGIFRSTDGGDTWTNITGNLGPEVTPWSLIVNPYDSFIYMGSSQGTWKLPPPYGINDVADTTAPNCSISINNGASYTNTTTVTLSLSATDNVGVTGYYLSASSTKPLASATGWTSVASTANYTGMVSYTLSSGDGTKTVYVWYKDAAGNVSNTASDSIILDTTVDISSGIKTLYLFDEGSGTITQERIGISKAISAPAFKYRVSLCWICFRIPERFFQWKSSGAIGFIGNWADIGELDSVQAGI